MLRSRLVAPVVVVALAGVLLAGCTPGSTTGPATPSTSADASGAPIVDPSASAMPTGPVPTPSPTPTPVTIGCNALVTNQAMYAFNPNYGLLSSWKPAAKTDGATAVADQGIACRWQNQTSGDTIDISAAHLDPASLQALGNNAFATSTMVPTYGDEAYFQVTNGVGTAIVFSGPYWIVASSAAFLEPGDCTDLINAAIAGLKKG